MTLNRNKIGTDSKENKAAREALKKELGLDKPAERTSNEAVGDPDYYKSILGDKPVRWDDF